MEIKEFIGVLLKRKNIVLLSTVIIFVIVAVWTMQLKPVYQSSIKILVQKTSPGLPGLSDLADLGQLTGNSNFSNPMSTQIELMKMRPVVERVIQQLDIRDEDGSLISYESMLKRVTISNVKTTDIVRLDVRSNDPVEAMNIANSIGRVFMEHDEKTKKEMANEIRRFIETQVAVTGRELAVAEVPMSKNINIAKNTRSGMITAQNYKDLLKKLSEAKISEALNISNVRIVEAAELPEKPISPKRLLNFLLGLIAGFMTGASIAVSLEYFDDSIKSPEELSAAVKLPILGSIPVLPVKDGKAVSLEQAKGFRLRDFPAWLFGMRPKTSKHALPVKSNFKELIILEDPNSPQSEAFRTVRTNIEFVRPDEPVKTMGVTSSVPNEGKTVFTCNLAVALAQTGKSILLVDCDLRQSRVHDIFGLKNDKGLSSYLSGVSDITDIIQRSGVNNLSIITAGPLSPNPSELLDSKRMKIFIDEQSVKYDHILIDSPPVNLVTDAAIMGSKLDGMLIVVDYQSTRKADVIEAKRLLSETMSDVLGLVIMKIVLNKKNKYYKKYYYRKFDIKKKQ
ncbi:MAG: polysaccharide biosynthesis tyrosine autokinase [Candidatus Saganbacteria bacterium]|nr:polysaccharide biosynthesis tyrosine autokinase [Candidatus Saganbacteria bacterium]